MLKLERVKLMEQNKLRQTISENKLAAWYFRLSVKQPYQMALIQITERCNLHCVHCCNFSSEKGRDISFKVFQEKLILQLKKFHIVTVTLTGGEPFLHPQILEIVKILRKANLRVAICTNGTLLTESQLKILKELGNIHINVSLNGFSSESHGKFCGETLSFKKILNSIRLLSKYRLLQGLIVTVNNLIKLKEYVDICKFAIQNKAVYIHFNPICEIGRAIKTKRLFETPFEELSVIKKITLPFSHKIQIVYIRFPNEDKLPLNSCEAGNIIHIFLDGRVTICPYLYSAAQHPLSKYSPEDFILGNIFKDENIAEKLNKYNFFEKFHFGENSICQKCSFNSFCGKGCPAEVIISGGQLDSNVDPLCPFFNDKV